MIARGDHTIKQTLKTNIMEHLYFEIDEEVKFINQEITYNWAMQEEVLFNVNKILQTDKELV